MALTVALEEQAKREVKYDKLVAETLYNLGMVHFERYAIKDEEGDSREAVHYFQRVEKITRNYLKNEEQDELRRSLAILHGKCFYTKGLMRMQREELKKAKECFKVDLGICRKMRDQFGELNTRVMLAKVDVSRNKLEKARGRLEEIAVKAGARRFMSIREEAEELIGEIKMIEEQRANHVQEIRNIDAELKVKDSLVLKERKIELLLECVDSREGVKLMEQLIEKEGQSELSASLVMSYINALKIAKQYAKAERVIKKQQKNKSIREEDRAALALDLGYVLDETREGYEAPQIAYKSALQIALRIENEQLVKEAFDDLSALYGKHKLAFQESQVQKEIRTLEDLGIREYKETQIFISISKEDTEQQSPLSLTRIKRSEQKRGLPAPCFRKKVIEESQEEKEEEYKFNLSPSFRNYQIQSEIFERNFNEKRLRILCPSCPFGKKEVVLSQETMLSELIQQVNRKVSSLEIGGQQVIWEGLFKPIQALYTDQNYAHALSLPSSQTSLYDVLGTRHALYIKQPQFQDIVDPVTLYRKSELSGAEKEETNKNILIVKRLKEQPRFLRGKILSLKDLKITNLDLCILSPLFFLHHSLIHLQIDSGVFTGDGLQRMSQICQYLQNFKDVTYSCHSLDLTNCAHLREEEGLVELLDTNKFKDVYKLNVSGCSFSENRGNVLVSKINTGMLVEELNLSSTQISPSLPIKSQLLIELNISHNNLTPLFVIQTLYTCTALEEINLDGTTKAERDNDSPEKSESQSQSKRTSLQKVKMNNSELVGVVIIDCFSLLKELKSLQAKNNPAFKTLLQETTKKLKLESLQI